MNNYKKIFHYISYFQFPFYLLGLYYAYEPIVFDIKEVMVSVNKSMLFMGLGIGFSTLQDTTRKQNKLSKLILKKPRYSKIYIIYMIVLIVTFLSFGLFGLLISDNPKINELSSGVIAMGIGVIGLLKTIMEIIENHNNK